jgi:hypothetical protein
MKRKKHSTFKIQHSTPRAVVLGEGEELIRIFHSSIETAKRNTLAAEHLPQGPVRY